MVSVHENMTQKLYREASRNADFVDRYPHLWAFDLAAGIELCTYCGAPKEGSLGGCRLNALQAIDPEHEDHRLVPSDVRKHFELVYIEPLRRRDEPLPGDFVQVTNSSDALAPTGTYGVIVGKKGSSAKLDVCFNPWPHPWGGGFAEATVHASGGPLSFSGHPRDRFIRTNKVIWRKFYAGGLYARDAVPTLVLPVKLWEIESR